MELHYRLGDEVHTVRVARAGERFRVTIGSEDRGHIVEVRRAEGGRLDLLVDGRALRAFAAMDGGRRFVQLEGGEPLALLRAEPRRQRARRAGAGGEESLTANMHGQVAAVLVKEGDRVERGATLVILEAMKMELRVVAPHAGRVKTVACKPGEVVERGRVLIELESGPEGAPGGSEP